MNYLTSFQPKTAWLATLVSLLALNVTHALTPQTITFPVIGDQPFAILTHKPSIAAYWEDALILKSNGAAHDPGNASAPILTGVSAIAVGFDHRMFLKADGTVWVYGGNSSGQLGTGDTISRSIPTQVMSNVVAISAGEGHSLFLKNDGSAWAAGLNSSRQFGATKINNFPQQVMTGVSSIMAGYANSFFVKTDGSLWVTGFNGYGQLGTGDTSNRSTPVQILTNVATVETGDAHSLFLKTDGSVWASGNNNFGQFGTGNTTSSNTPVQVMTSVSAIAADEIHSLFLKPDASVLTGGGVSSTPLVGTFYAIAAGKNNFSLGIRTNGSVSSNGSGLASFQTFVPNTVSLAASSSSELPISYNIVSGPATRSGSTITLTGQGAVTVTASQPGNATYSAATPVTMIFNASKGPQSITFSPLPDKMEGDLPFSINASTSSGLAPIFSIVSGPATISGRLVTITGPGTITVRASQPGDPLYAAAVPVEQSFSASGIELSSKTVFENDASGAFVGDFSLAGAAGAAPHAYSLELGFGSEDNADFSIADGYLYLNAVADYEVKTTYRIRIRATSLDDASYQERSFTLEVIDINESGAWSETSSLATARREHSATLLLNGKVLVAAGRGSDSLGMNSSELYDPATGNWTAGGALSTPRFAHSAVLLADGRVLVCGGTPQSAGGVGMTSCEIFDPITNSWTVTGDLGAARYSHQATLLSNGKVMVSGGRTNTVTPIGATEVFDPSTGTWTDTGSLNTARFSHTTTLLANGKVLLAGGSQAIGSDLVEAELYDPATGIWSVTGSLSSERSRHTATPLTNGKVLVAGGISFGIHRNTAEIFDPTTGSWSKTGAMIFACSRHTANLMPDGQVWCTGGFDGGTSIGRVQVFNPASGTWTLNNNLITGRSFHASTLLPNNTLLVTGGTPDNFNVISSAEIFGLGSTSAAAAQALFANWGTESGLSGPNAALTATPFNDGVENLLKYAFNMNAAGPDVRVLTAGGSAGLPQVTVDTSGAEPVLEVAFLRRKGSGLIYTPQRSDTLGNFQAMTGTQTVTFIDAQWERVTVEEPAPAATAPRAFARVQVGLP